MIREAVILAGGLGTRLREAVPDLPKCMAPVNGQPFIYYILKYCISQGLRSFIFSLGYKHEIIEQYLKDFFGSGECEWKVFVEEEPLGTGGGARMACDMAASENIFLLNGDTMFRCDFNQLASVHESKKADCTLSLKLMEESMRYGIVETGIDQRVVMFREKDHYRNSLINAGVYALNVKRFLEEKLPEKFSFEKDYLEALFRDRPVYGLAQTGYFIDIGIPEDYARANRDFIELTKLE